MEVSITAYTIAEFSLGEAGTLDLKPADCPPGLEEGKMGLPLFYSDQDANLSLYKAMERAFQNQKMVSLVRLKDKFEQGSGEDRSIHSAVTVMNVDEIPLNKIIRLANASVEMKDLVMDTIIKDWEKSGNEAINEAKNVKSMNDYQSFLLSHPEVTDVLKQSEHFAHVQAFIHPYETKQEHDGRRLTVYEFNNPEIRAFDDPKLKIMPPPELWAGHPLNKGKEIDNGPKLN